MSIPDDRREALAVLRVPPSADAGAIKQAYRRLARDHHPDRGGDPDRFHELQVAYELLLTGEATARPVRPAGRPSRPAAAWDADRVDRRAAVDVGTVDWDGPTSTGVLDTDVLARLLADAPGSTPIGTVVATSRAPGSRLNRAASRLSPDLTAELRVTTEVDDRARVVVVTTLRTGNRRARRAVEAVALDGGWIRSRRSSTTILRHVATPDDDARTTAVRTVRHVCTMLDRLGWPLGSWAVTGSGSSR